MTVGNLCGLDKNVVTRNLIARGYKSNCKVYHNQNARKIGIGDIEISLTGLFNGDIVLESKAYAFQLMQSGSTL